MHKSKRFDVEISRISSEKNLIFCKERVVVPFAPVRGSPTLQMRAPEGFQMRAVENHRRLFRERRGALYERGTRRKEFYVFNCRYFFFVKTRVKNTHERTKMVRGGATSPRSLRVRYTVSQRLWWYRDHYACVCFLLALLSSRRYCWCCRRLRAAGVQFRQHVFLPQVRLKLSHSRG